MKLVSCDELVSMCGGRNSEPVGTKKTTTIATVSTKLLSTSELQNVVGGSCTCLCDCTWAGNRNAWWEGIRSTPKGCYESCDPCYSTTYPFYKVGPARSKCVSDVADTCTVSSSATRSGIGIDRDCLVIGAVVGLCLLF